MEVNIMEKQDIMVNEEVMEVAEEFTAGSGNGLKVVGGVLAVVGLAYAGYKLAKRIKAKKVQYGTPEVPVISEDECVEVDE